MIKSNRKIEGLEAWEGFNYVVNFRFDLSSAINEFGNRKDSLEDFNNAIAYAIARLGLGVCSAPKAMICITIKLLSTLAHVIFHVLDDTESQFSLDADDKIIILEAVLFFKS
jgi:hypothetical protein